MVDGWFMVDINHDAPPSTMGPWLIWPWTGPGPGPWARALGPGLPGTPKRIAHGARALGPGLPGTPKRIAHVARALARALGPGPGAQGAQVAPVRGRPRVPGAQGAPGPPLGPPLGAQGAQGGPWPPINHGTMVDLGPMGPLSTMLKVRPADQSPTGISLHPTMVLEDVQEIAAGDRPVLSKTPSGVTSQHPEGTHFVAPWGSTETIWTPWTPLRALKGQ